MNSLEHPFATWQQAHQFERDHARCVYATIVREFERTRALLAETRALLARKP